MRIKVLYLLLAVLLFCACGQKETVKVKAKEPARAKGKVEEVVPKASLEETAKEDQDLNQVEVVVRTNPFLTRAEEDFFIRDIRERIEYLNVSAIFYSPSGSYAIVNGNILKEGGIIDNKEVVKIDREEVILKDYHGQEYLVGVGSVINK